jgi:tRNA pseudouridine55 synthase
VDGLLVIDKPAGPTSHDVVARLRRILRERRIGHTGTLDPAATGVLPLVLGRATRLARFLSARDKEYEAVIRFGIATDTYDAHGVPSGARHEGPWPTRDAIDRALDAFRGSFLQQPPAFSAKKIEGQPSYIAARAARQSSGARHHSFTGAGAPPPARTDADASPRTARHGRRRSLPAAVSVTAHTIDIVTVEGDCVTLRIDCSAGFYVRSLAHDLGDRLGVGAHLTTLRRTRSGDLTVADAVPLDVAERDPEAARAAVIPVDRMLPSLSAVVLTDAGARHVAHGRDVASGDIAGGSAAIGSPAGVTGPLSPPPCVRLMTENGQLLGIAEPAVTPGLLHPSVVLV